MNWIQAAGETLSEEPQDEEIPEITEIDKLPTFVGNKKNKGVGDLTYDVQNISVRSS